MPDLEIVEITNNSLHIPSLPADERAKVAFEGLKKNGTYNPLRYNFELDENNKQMKSTDIPPVTDP
jgi:hypothetical protein